MQYAYSWSHLVVLVMLLTMDVRFFINLSGLLVRWYLVSPPLLREADVGRTCYWLFLVRITSGLLGVVWSGIR